jgi:8-oxo-dGTP pyrophosphatase MutT (NUDIX family)
MKLLRHIEDSSFTDNKDTWKRFASRAVAFDENNLVSILFVSKFNYHKLPGGGIDKGENIEEACKRELIEETGCEIEIGHEIGIVTERRKEWNFDQTSYCFLGKVIKKGEQHLEQDEINDGFELVWLTLDEAIKTLKKDKPQNYEGKFIQERDLVFLEEAEKIIHNV